MSYMNRERPYRGRARPRAAAPKSDAATAALTAQVILCALMIICVLIMKKLDASGYDGFKAVYSNMISQSSGEMFSWVENPGGAVSGLWENADAFFGGLFSPVPAPQPDTEDQYEGIDLNEPEDPSESANLPEYELSYDYLDGETVSYVNAGGGVFSAAANTGNMMPAPAGCVLSPVYLGAKIQPPVAGSITSGFNYRYHPVTGKSDFHTGIDIAAEEGRAILAVLPGEVAEVGYNEIYGNYIVLKHATNLQTSYSHCSKIIAKAGMSVRQGERIALVGKTGTVTGPHLHFSVIVEGEYTDPAWVLSDYIKLVE